MKLQEAFARKTYGPLDRDGRRLKKIGQTDNPRLNARYSVQSSN